MQNPGITLEEAVAIGLRIGDCIAAERGIATKSQGFAALAFLSRDMDYWDAYSVATTFGRHAKLSTADVLTKLACGAVEQTLAEMPLRNVLPIVLPTLEGSAWKSWHASSDFLTWCQAQSFQCIGATAAAFFVAAQHVAMLLGDDMLALADEALMLLADCAAKHPDRGHPDVPFQECAQGHYKA
jgi:hypothetical protein